MTETDVPAREQLREELVREEAPDRVTELVLAACAGSDRLAAVINGSAGSTTAEKDTPARPAGRTKTDAEVPAVFLRSISVRGFRGVGPTATLPLVPGPGLTVALGRNGSGKSSFAEAAEFALTGATDRAKRGALWTDGWRSLHHTAEPTRVQLELTAEGSGTLTVVHEWPAGAGLHDGTTTVHGDGKLPIPLADLGWQPLLELWRPFLAYSELSGLITDRSSSIFDRISRLLGLEDLTAAEQHLVNANKELTRELRTVRDERAALLRELSASDDPRAFAVTAALGSQMWKSWKLEDAEAIARSGGWPCSGQPAPQVALDREVLALAVVSAEVVAVEVARLRTAAQGLAGLSGTPADEARRLASLLRAGLEHQERHGDGPCPLCHAGTLDAAWRVTATAEVERLTALAAHAEATRVGATDALAAARMLVVAPPAVLSTAASSSDDEGRLAAEVLTAWERWLPLRSERDPGVLADGFERYHPPLAGALTALRAAVEGRVEARDAVWSPLAERVLAWVRAARAACAHQPIAKELDLAVQKLHAVIERLRDQKLEPYRAQHAAIWSKLRQESNVDLGPLRLEGRSTSRRVKVDVTVDGTQTQALGVMSQGELHTLGLTLFLPQATAPESPFRFLVIDDPVQAMDPSKVDGLAQVLLETAKTRQVVVFTHDDRLGDAVRRLASFEDAARLVEVVRWEGSVVTVRPVDDPAKRCLEDARSLAATPDLPDGVKRGLVPGYCKSALDAVCNDIHRRRRLAGGANHRSVEKELLEAGTAARRVALVVCNNADKPTTQVRIEITRRWDSATGETFMTLAHAGHERYTGDCKQLVRDTRELVKKLRTL
ncbi:AAA family ATPase [Pseudofrankia sp. DC12]|uniref:AAA family ATPase n=1 Tax=Pseudofrankia sp. DC12 TaxID=683315 RepID=UPI0005F76501|nr:AAA family ATPase [Pseudofrankia sp. DC12]